MAVNCVVPSRERGYDEAGAFLGMVEPPVFRVEQEAIVRLVARGVVPFSYLELRSDFATRFAGCTEAEHVIDVLRSEGFYPRPKGEFRAGYDRRVEAARERVKKRRARAEA